MYVEKNSLHKRIVYTVSIVLASLLLLVALAAAKEPKRMSFQGTAVGPGGIMWGAGGVPQYMYGTIEYNTTLDDGLFNIGGTGQMNSTERVRNLLGNNTWELENLKSSAAASAEWVDEDGESHRLRVTFTISDETDCVYGASETYWARPEGPVLTYVEAMILGLNLSKTNIEDACDTQYATMTFQGTLDGERVEGKALIVMWYVEEFRDRVVFVNLWVDNGNGAGTYALIVWSCRELQIPLLDNGSDGWQIPAARMLRVHFKPA